MKELFKGYYRPNDEEFKKMWDEGTFVFDTNVLLNLYRYKKETRDAILEILDRIQDRVWIPYQVGLEFHRGRLGVIAKQNDVLKDFKDSITASIENINSKYKELQLDKRHTDIMAEPILKQFEELSKTVIEDLDKIEQKKLSNCMDDDEILIKVTKLFEDKVGDLPENQKWLDDIFKEGDERAKNNIPPSFKDITKAKKDEKEGYGYNGLFYKAGYGDFILWKQLLDYAKVKNKKYIALITDDNKDDWMLTVKGKTISARPELITEICNQSGVEIFHIYNTESFLMNSKTKLNSPLSEEIIKDVGKVNNKGINSRFLLKSKIYGEEVESKIINWLEEKYDIVKSMNANISGFDFTGYSSNSGKTLIKYKLMTLNKINKKFIQYLIDSINHHFIRKQVDSSLNRTNYHIILVIEFKDILTNSIDDIVENVKNIIEEVIDESFINIDKSFRITFSLGYIDTINTDSFKVISNRRYLISP